MCGIFGYFNKNFHSLPQSIVTEMGTAIYHRGPDDQGIFFGEGFALGNQRLSIIDVAGGHQPFVSDDGQIVVVQNGEIFNHIELAEELAQEGIYCKTHSDTEVILRLYEKHGISFIPKLNGMFAIAIYDNREKALYLIRDRIGVKPLHLYDDGKTLYFASEIKSLLRSGIPRVLNTEALHYYLSYNYIPAPYTLFKNITHLMYGHYLKITPHSQTTHCWWDLANILPEERSEDDWIEEFNAILEDAVRLRLRSDVPFGAFLSGGVDSSSVVGMMAKLMNKPVRTYCIGFHDPLYDESPFALEAAQRFKTDHIMERVDMNMLDLWPKAIYHCDQPHGDVSFMPTYKVSELAARDLKVVLTGDGGDELFAGYDKYKDFFNNTPNNLSQNQFEQFYIDSISLFNTSQRKELYNQDLNTKLLHNNPYEMAHSLFKKVPHFDRINQALFIDMSLLLSGNNLVKPDRMGMAVSLEARTPFLDYRMMEFAFKMPGNLKLNNQTTKYLYKKAVTPLIGENLAYRKKQMFTVPIGDWLRNKLFSFTTDILLSPKATSRGLFNKTYIQDLLSQHQKGTKNCTREIRALIALELWFQIFIDGQGKPQDIPLLKL